MTAQQLLLFFSGFKIWPIFTGSYLWNTTFHSSPNSRFDFVVNWQQVQFHCTPKTVSKTAISHKISAFLPLKLRSSFNHLRWRVHCNHTILRLYDDGVKVNSKFVQSISKFSLQHLIFALIISWYIRRVFDYCWLTIQLVKLLHSTELTLISPFHYTKNRWRIFALPHKILRTEINLQPFTMTNSSPLNND